jgi:drug/metabolite transporter (DMT)-like permease
VKTCNIHDFYTCKTLTPVKILFEVVANLLTVVKNCLFTYKAIFFNYNPFCIVRNEIFSFEQNEWLILLGLILGAQLLGHTMFNSALKRVSPAVVSLIVFFEVPVSAVLAAWWLNQTPPIGVIPGIALILIGCILVVTRTRGAKSD